MSGVDERVETVRGALHEAIDQQRDSPGIDPMLEVRVDEYRDAIAALDSLAAAVADAEQREQEYHNLWHDETDRAELAEQRADNAERERDEWKADYWRQYEAWNRAAVNAKERIDAAEQRADEAEKAWDKAVELAEHAAALAELYGQAIVDIHQIDGLDIRVRLICARLDTEGFSAAAVVSAEPTEEAK